MATSFDPKQDAPIGDTAALSFTADSAGNAGKMTPMFVQYMGIKKQYPDALLFYRMGDFYELFFSDAVTASRELQITLTSRNPGADKPVPMCGVPHHAAKSYIAQLTEKGYKVAICEQMEDPKSVKGLVKRAVIHVHTPGTCLDELSLDAKSHSFLGAYIWDAAKGNGAFAWLDYSTGEWSGLFSKRENELWQWIQKLSPRELLVPDVPPEELHMPKGIELAGVFQVRVPGRSFFNLTAATEKILKAQGVAALDALGLADKESLTRACGALLTYLQQTQKQDVGHLAPFAPLNLGQHLIIDEVSERNLELFRRLDGSKGSGTLFHTLDETMTPMGGRLLQERLRHPWRDLKTIVKTQEAVDFFVKHDDVRQRLRESLDTVYDLERLSTRISLNRANPKDFVGLRDGLAGLALVREALSGSYTRGRYATADEYSGQALPPPVLDLLNRWDPLEDQVALLAKSIVDAPPPLITEGGLFKPGYNAELDELLDLVEHGEQKLQALLEKEQAATGIARMRLGFNKVFGYFFEISRSQTTNLPERFIRRQTLANAERLVTPELRELEEKLLSASEQWKKLEYTLFQNLREAIAESRERIMFMASLVAALDYWQSLAEIARNGEWTRPELHDGLAMLIRNGRHPVVEAAQGKASFVPNDLRMDDDRHLLLITGPNMAGKSTVLRQTAILCILAQMGSFVPASAARIGLVDRLFSRVGASDNLSRGQSTFMVEMMETARILRQATSKSLVILDEIGRGTSTFDGMAIAWSVVEDLAKRAKGSIRTLFATHYHELTSLEGCIPGVCNMNIAVAESGGEIIFLRRLVPGPADKSYGIEVARLAGVPPLVVQRARQILEALEKNRGPKAARIETLAMRQLLPGLLVEETPPVQEEVKQPEKEHPLLTALKELDINHLSPVQAALRLQEWKTLWGGDAV